MLRMYFVQQWFNRADESSRMRCWTSRRCGDEIDEEQRSMNHNKSKVRARVERVFAVAKRPWGFVKVRYRGLANI